MVARFDPPHTLAMSRFLRRHSSRVVGMINNGKDVVIYTRHAEFHGETEPEAILAFIRGEDSPKARGNKRTASRMGTAGNSP